MAYFNSSDGSASGSHPLDVNIEEIDLSKCKSYQESQAYYYNKLSGDKLDEIDLRTAKPERPEVPARPKKYSTPQPDSVEAKSSTKVLFNPIHFKANPGKRQAPRILPKVPDPPKNSAVSLVTQQSVPRVSTASPAPLATPDVFVVKSNISPLKNVSPPKILPLNKQESAPAIRSDNEHSFYIQMEQVGWFYKKDPTAQASDLSGAIDEMGYINSEPTSGDSSLNPSNPLSSQSTNNNRKWQPFSKVDSLKLESKFRAMQSDPANESNRYVQVLDDIYEVNLTTKKCYAIYWKGKRTFSVMRSIWFQENGEPFEEISSVAIETKHMEMFRDVICKSTEFESSINSTDLEMIRADGASSPTDQEGKRAGSESKTLVEPLDSITIEDGVVTWYSKDEVCWEKNKMSILEKVNFGFSKFRNKMNGMKIKRGLKIKSSQLSKSENDLLTDSQLLSSQSSENAVSREQEITHLVFVVHGIAQRMYEGGIIKNAEDLRKECEKKKKEYFPNSRNKRFMFLPVDWRSSLTLDDGIVDTITPNSIQTIREKLNSSALDIMYYTSPLFRIEILNSLSSEVNRLYSKFCEKHPSFLNDHGKVSFVAHSLGTVIVYDLLTSDNSINFFSNPYSQVTKSEREKFHRYSHNDSALLEEYLNARNRIQEIESNLVKSNNNILPLPFQTENFFSLGSPLGVFLAMRGVRPAGTGTQEHILPKHLCKNLFNIFHPSDPIAYRIEPLIIKHYTNKSPIEIQKADVVPKVSYKELNERRTAYNLDSKTSSTTTSSSSSIGSVSVYKNKNKENQMEPDVAFNPGGVSIGGYTSAPAIEQVELETALDFQLQDSNFELMATLRAHGCYWKSPDNALFIMTQLCEGDEPK